MTKEEFIRSVARNQNLTIKKTGEVFNEIIETLKETLADEGKFFVKGFGTFSVTRRAARQGRNPQTGEAIRIPESVTLKFKTAPTLKDSLNEKMLSA